MRKSLLLAGLMLSLWPGASAAQLGSHTRHDWTVHLGEATFGLKQIDVEGSFDYTSICLGWHSSPIRLRAVSTLCLALILVTAAIALEVLRELSWRRRERPR